MTLVLPFRRRPFGESIREHLIPLLSSPAWWEKTVADMRKLVRRLSRPLARAEGLAGS